MAAVKKPRKKKYLNNKDLLALVSECLETGIMSDALARMFQAVCFKVSRRACFVGYTYNADMQAYAMLMIVRTWKAFKPEKSSNPLGFYSLCIERSFIQFLNQEKKHRNIRDAQLVANGLLPSHAYQEACSTKPDTENDEITPELTLDTHNFVDL